MGFVASCDNIIYLFILKIKKHEKLKRYEDGEESTRGFCR